MNHEAGGRMLGRNNAEEMETEVHVCNVVRITLGEVLKTLGEGL